jgi:hypothetical protein
MYRIRTSYYPDGSPHLQVDLPPLSEPQLYLLECVVDAVWCLLGPQAPPTWYGPSSRSWFLQPSTTQKSPRAATPGPETQLTSPSVKGET